MAEIAEVWRRGSVVGSWLLDLTAAALAENPSLSNYSGFVQDSGEDAGPPCSDRGICAS
jgi:6-phosphogluconate dehydrogenase